MSVKILKTVLLISLPILLFSCGEEEEVKKEVVRPIKVLKVSSGGSGEFSFPGVVDAGKKVVLSFRVNGRVMALPVMEGDNVSKGQLLARLDPKDFELNVTQAKAQFVKAHADYERYQTLYEKDAVPIADLDLKRAQRDVAKSQLDEAEKNGLLDRIEAEKIRGKVNVQRFKGLGEMNPLQLRETTIAPDTRRLVRLTIDEDDETDQMMDMLLAKKRSADRRSWLENKGNLADI